VPETDVRPEPCSPFEKRQFERYQVALTVTVCLEDSTECREAVNKTLLSEPRTACIEDLSVSGLRFVSTAAFPIGGVVGLRLRLGGRSFGLQAIVQRRFDVPLSGKRCFGCGVQFARTAQALDAVPAIARYLKTLTLPVKEIPFRQQDEPPPDAPLLPPSSHALLDAPVAPELP